MAAFLINRMKQAEMARNLWHVSPRPEDGPECLLDPKWWVNAVPRLRAGDKIEVLAETGEWYAECVVMSTGTFGAKVAVTLGPVKLQNEAAIEQADDYEIKWAGPHAKYRVIRRKDMTVLKDQCQTQEEAASWVKSHRKAMAA